MVATFGRSLALEVIGRIISGDPARLAHDFFKLRSTEQLSVRKSRS
jgi:hypothetical protein